MSSLSVVSELGARVVNAIEAQEWLDEPGYRVEHGLALTFNLFGRRAEKVRNFLHGTWLGHPLHPVLTDVPLGAWSVALALDAADTVHATPWAGRAAQFAVAVGVAGATAAAVTGLTDWQYTHDRGRRTGMVHGLVNLGAVGLYSWSWRDRRTGRQGRGQVASLIGFGLVSAASYLGGHLVYRDRIGVDHTEDPAGPHAFMDVAAAEDLVSDGPLSVRAGDVAVVVVRHGDTIHAVSGRCPHLGAPLGEGWVHRDGIECPWHGSLFDLATGKVLKGPAVAPLACFEVRERDGRIEVRRRTAVEAR